MKKLGLVFIFVLLLSSFVLAGAYTKEDAEKCIEDSTNYLNNLHEKGFNTARINDSLQKILAIHEGQIAKENKKQSVNFGLIESYCEEVKDIYSLAIAMKDEYRALTEFYELSFVDGMDNTESKKIIDEAALEIDNERYEKVLPLVDKGYDEIFNMVEEYSSLNKFYKSATLGIKTFFVKNYKIMLITLFGLGILYIIFRLPIKRKLIKIKIENLRVRRYSLKEYLKKIQKDYFDNNKISQRDYTIYSDNFSKMLRSIDKDVALLNERLIKITPKDKVKEFKSDL